MTIDEAKNRIAAKALVLKEKSANRNESATKLREGGYRADALTQQAEAAIIGAEAVGLTTALAILEGVEP